MNAKQHDDDGTAQSEHEQDPVSRAVSKPAMGAVPPEKRKAIYTMNAQEGLDVAELVNAAFGRKKVGSKTARRLEIFVPDGPSTAGGKHAHQTMRLVPISGDSSPVMCGSLNVGQKVVELRSYEALNKQYEARFGVPCDMTAEEYVTLTRELQMVLTPFRYTFTQEADKPVALPTHTADGDRLGRASQRLQVFVAVLFVIIAVAVALTLLR